MITHEEARNLVNELVPTDAITPSQIDDLHIYITEQEKKEQRAKKVEELLYWYRESWKSMRDGRLERKIEALEKELEEMK